MYSILYLPVKLRLIVYFVYPWLYGSRQKQCAALLALSGWLTCKYIYIYIFFFSLGLAILFQADEMLLWSRIHRKCLAVLQ